MFPRAYCASALALFGRLASQPAYRLGIGPAATPSRTLPVGVHDPEQVLRTGEALLGGHWSHQRTASA